MTTDDRATAAIREAAAEWLVCMNDANVGHQDRAAFTAWLRASPVHVREYLRVEATWLALQKAAQRDDTDVAALLQQARANVVELYAYAEQTDAAPPRRRHRVHFAIAATVAFAAVGTLALLQRERFDPNVYATGIGEMRRVVLSDGSAVELNTHSKIRIDFSTANRNIRLEQGEAYFSVAKDPARPFRVISGAMLVRAIGTEFNVYRKPKETVVTVVEGKVALQNPGQQAAVPRPRDSATPAATAPSGAAGEGASPVVELTAGHAIHVAPDVDLRVAAASVVDTQRAVAWRQRRLVFDDTALADIVAEFNRYNRQQLAVQDPMLAGQRISGVFDPGKPQSLVRFLARDGNVTARELSGNRLLLVRGDEIVR